MAPHPLTPVSSSSIGGWQRPDPQRPIKPTTRDLAGSDASSYGAADTRLKGRVRLTHRFCPGREDGNIVDAMVVAYLEFEPARRWVRRLRLVTERASYGKGTLDVAVRSVP
jgi:hypothetical protein